MKPTIPLTVILFVTGMEFIGGSCNTREKTAVATNDNIFPEMPAKEEKAAASVPSAQLANKQEALPKATSFKLIKPHYNKIEVKGDSAPYCGVAQWTDIDMSDSIRTCNLETEAEYPGGPAAWQRFLNRNLRCPVDSIDSEMCLNAVVQFEVDKEGNVSNVEAVSGSEALGTEAVRVIKKSGRWTPARQVKDGRSVRSIKRQPFMIHLEFEE